MKRFVMDASLASGWVLKDEPQADAARAMTAIVSRSHRCEVPALWMYEMLSVLLVSRRRNRLTDEQVAASLDLIAQMPMQSHEISTGVIMERIVKFADDHKLTTYDAAYLELADRFRCPLLTSDKQLAAAAERIGISTKL